MSTIPDNVKPLSHGHSVRKKKAYKKVINAMPGPFALTDRKCEICEKEIDLKVQKLGYYLKGKFVCKFCYLNLK